MNCVLKHRAYWCAIRAVQARIAHPKSRQSYEALIACCIASRCNTYPPNMVRDKLRQYEKMYGTIPGRRKRYHVAMRLVDQFIINDCINRDQAASVLIAGMDAAK